MRRSMVLLATVLLTCPAWGATLRVPQDYPTIQAAVDAAAPGDEILISPGSYPEGVEIEKSITLRATGEVQVGDSLLAGVCVRAGEVLIEGLGLTGALRVEGTAHVVLSRCTLEGTWVSGGSTLELVDCGAAGGTFGLYAMGPAILLARRSELAGISLMMGAQLILEECQVAGDVLLTQASLTASNSQFEGQMDLGAASLVLSGCQVAGAVSLGPRAGAVLEDCTFVVDQIGLSLRADAQAEARGCRFTGGQVAVDLSDQAELELADCEIAGSKGAGIRAWDRSRLRLIRVRVADAGEYGVLAKGEVSLHLEGSTFSRCGDGLRLLSGATAAVEDCAFLDNRLYGMAVLSGSSVSGSGNEFRGNGCDLIGEVAPGVRTPLRTAELEEVLFPSPEFTSLQEALDALFPGGTLILSPGVQTAGAVIDKPVVIRGAQSALSAPNLDLPAISVILGGELLLAGVEIRGGAFGLVVAGAASARLVGVRVIGGRVGIALRGAAELTLEGCEITGNDTGLELRGDSRAQVLDSRFSGNTGAGIYLWDRVSLHLEGSILTGNARGVVCYVRGCGSPWAPAEFAGSVTGGGNEISGNTEADLCPVYPGPPWPADFLAPPNRGLE